MPWSCTAFRYASGSKRDMVTSVAPWRRVAFSTMIRPKAWWNGGTASTFSPASRGATVLVWSTLAIMFRCVSSTPLGKPVLPLECRTVTTSAAGSTAAPGDASAASSSEENGVVPAASPNTMTFSTFVRVVSSSALATSDGVVTRKRASASFRCVVRSSAVSSGLSTITAPPARTAAW